MNDAQYNNWKTIREKGRKAFFKRTLMYQGIPMGFVYGLIMTIFAARDGGKNLAVSFVVMSLFFGSTMSLFIGWNTWRVSEKAFLKREAMDNDSRA